MQAKANQKEWKKHQETLEECKEAYEYDNLDDNAYYREGLAYVELFKLSLDKDYLQKAIQSYGKAIEINPENAAYLVDRSKVYVELDLPEEAVKDFQLIAQLPKSNKDINSIYAQHVQKSLAKLDSIKSTISKLRSRGDLPDDFLQSYQELVNVTQGLVLKVGLHDEQIRTLFDQNKENKQKYKEIEQKFNKLMNQAEKGKLTVKEMNKQVLELRQKVVSLENKMIRFVSKDELDQMAASIDQRLGDTEKKVEFCNSKIIIVEGQVDKQKVKIAHVDDALKKCNIYKKNELKERFAELRTQDAQLYEYANVFYWTFSNYVLAYRVISTGLVKGQQEDNKLVSLAKKATGLFSDVISSIPGIGSVISLIEEGLNALYEGYKSERIARKYEKINQIISKNALEEDINLGILAASIEIALYREDVIRADPKKQTTIQAYETFLESRSWFQQKIDKIITSLTGIQKVYQTQASKAALADVLLLLGYLMTSDVIIVKNGEDYFHEELLAQFKKGALEDHLIELKKAQKEKKKKEWKWPWSN